MKILPTQFEGQNIRRIYDEATETLWFSVIEVATDQTLLRLVQSVPSPKAEPSKLWLAKVGYERMQKMADPALSLNRTRQAWRQHGRSDKWIAQRMTGQDTRNFHHRMVLPLCLH